MGNELFKGEQDLEEHYEKIRKVIENEDYVPSFQYFVDSDSGFGSFSD
jgi:hypothetical protein